MTDVELLAALFAHRPTAWTALVDRYASLVRRCVARILSRAHRRQRADIDEVAAEVWLQLVKDDMRKLRMFDPARGTKLATWIATIACNTARDALRSAARRPPLADAGELPDIRDDHQPSPLATLVDKQRWEQANTLLRELSARDREFVELFFRDGLDADAVAAAMRINRKTVYTKSFKIRAQLARALAARVDAGEVTIADLAA
jgi:RNA polymerase sigma-70 factor (ECF subfamily)